MNRSDGLLEQLIQAFQCLPSVGERSARRMTHHLLEHDRSGGQHLSQVLTQALESIGRCEQCRTLTESTLCNICADPQRDVSLLCVVEHANDVAAVDHATQYSGKYFVLGGNLSPLDGVGPEDIGLDLLDKRLAGDDIAELILANTPTVEGEVTAHYLRELAERHQVPCTRIAHGVPVGSELELVDSGTLAHAFQGRKKYR